MKKCACGETDITKFGKDKNKWDGLKYLCKACHNRNNTKARSANPDGYRATNLAYARSPKGRALMRANKLRRDFWPHLSNDEAVAEYERKFLDQGGKCALCDRPQSQFSYRLHVDHCHETGVIRGLLCGPCNRVEVQDKNLERVRRLYDYFIKYHG